LFFDAFVFDTSLAQKYIFTPALYCRAPDIDLSALETLFSTAFAINANEK
jgi:hypothetical protein